MADGPIRVPAEFQHSRRVENPGLLAAGSRPKRGGHRQLVGVAVERQRGGEPTCQTSAGPEIGSDRVGNQSETVQHYRALEGRLETVAPGAPVVQSAR